MPCGKLGNPEYEERLEEFAKEIRALKISVTPSSRGWAYILEGEGKVDKSQFPAVGKAIGDCIKAGYLPLSIIAEDQDETRRFREIEAASDALGVLRELQEEVEDFEGNLKQATTDYLAGEKYFLMMIVEKGDIRNLFEPICEEYHVPIASSKGWASNALFRNSGTLEAGKKLCRDAIQKYLGKDALARFRKKEEKGIKLNEDQLEILEKIKTELEEIEETLPQEPQKKEVEAKRTAKSARGKEVIVTPEPGYYPCCPKCENSFNIDEDRDDGKLFRCKYCGQYMRLRLEKKEGNP